MTWRRTIAAFLVAPLMTPFVILLSDQSHGAPFNLAEQFIAFLFIAAFAYAATVLFGIPAFFLFRAKRWTNVFLYMLTGGVIGLLFSVLLNYRISFNVLALEYRAWWAIAGSFSALVFRIVLGAKFDHVSIAPARAET
jgi:hypothetical protein